MLFDSVRRGAVAGAAAGVVHGAFVALVANPLVEYVEHAGHGHGAESVVSKTTAAAASVAGGVLWGVLLGAAFGVAYYLLEPSLPGSGPRRVYALAAAGFLTVSGLPWLVLPPVAPGTEHALATGTRLAVYGGSMAVGAVACALSLLVYRRVRGEHGRVAAGAVATVPFLLCGLGAFAVPTGTSGGPPAALATAFTWLVAFGQVGLWAVLATAFDLLRRPDAVGPDAQATVDELVERRTPAGD